LSLLKSFYGRSGFRWMLKLPLLYEVWPTFFPEEAPVTSQFLRRINALSAAASSLRQAKKRLTSSYQVISPAL
jgi:hypothetical protein